MGSNPVWRTKKDSLPYGAGNPFWYMPFLTGFEPRGKRSAAAGAEEGRTVSPQPQLLRHQRVRDAAKAIRGKVDSRRLAREKSRLASSSLVLVFRFSTSTLALPFPSILYEAYSSV